MTSPFIDHEWTAPQSWLHDMLVDNQRFARIVETQPSAGKRYVWFRLHMRGHVMQEFTSLIKAKRAAEACLPLKKTG